MYAFTAVANSTHGELIDMSNAAETEAAKVKRLHTHYFSKSLRKHTNIHISIARPEHYYDSLQNYSPK